MLRPLPDDLQAKFQALLLQALCRLEENVRAFGTDQPANEGKGQGWQRTLGGNAARMGADPVEHGRRARQLQEGRKPFGGRDISRNAVTQPSARESKQPHLQGAKVAVFSVAA